jgi:Zn2+/Cd2+-exporting ATPase
MGESLPKGEVQKYILEGLDCASCAAKIEAAFKKEFKRPEIVINFATKMVSLPPGKLIDAQNIVNKIENGVTILPVQQNPDSELKSGSPELRLDNLRLVLAIILFAAGFIIDLQSPYLLFGTKIANWLLLAAYLLVGVKVIKISVQNIFRGEFFDENFLMTVATLGAILLNQLSEAVGVMVFYSIGEYFQNLAVNKSRRSIKELLALRPDYANAIINGEIRKVSPEEIVIGQDILIRPGEKVPLDGEIIEGTGIIDTSPLTGEAMPRKVKKGNEVLAGMINLNSLITVKVKRSYHDSSLAKILEMVEEAGTHKAPTELFITKFSRYYTPFVVFTALGIALLPPLIGGGEFSDWIYRALILLVISCPCALVVSIPLGYFGGIGGASKQGILIKGANYLEALTELHTVAFDKTGTLTKGNFKVSKIIQGANSNLTPPELLKVAAMAEIHSTHPIAKAIVEAYSSEYPTGSEGDIKLRLMGEYKEIPGLGLKVVTNEEKILIGNHRLMEENQINYPLIEELGTIVYIAINSALAGYLVIADEIKEDTPQTIQDLKELGVKDIVMLTGDHQDNAKAVSQKVGIDKYFAELLPLEKVNIVTELKKSLKKKRQKLAFVGDGINDAPVLTRADIGIAMGGLGSDAAIEAADVVIMQDQPSKVVTAVRIAKATRKIIIQNVIFALGVKGIFIGLGTLGVATMWEAVFADVGVTLLAVLNSTRALYFKE